MFRHCPDRLRLLHRLQRVRWWRLQWLIHIAFYRSMKKKLTKSILLLVAHDVAFVVVTVNSSPTHTPHPPSKQCCTVVSGTKHDLLKLISAFKCILHALSDCTSSYSLTVEINVQFHCLLFFLNSFIFYPVSVEIPALKIGHTCTAGTATTDCGVTTTTHLECSATAPTVCVCSTGYSGSPGGDCGR